MPQEIRTIYFGWVNCYLIKTDSGYILIDTGFLTKRTDLEKKLESAGYQPVRGCHSAGRCAGDHPGLGCGNETINPVSDHLRCQVVGTQQQTARCGVSSRRADTCRERFR